MGNSNSAQPIQKINEFKETKEDDIKEPFKTELKYKSADAELFDRIAQLSNNLIMEYGNLYLKPNFCNKIAIIYKNKLSKINIDILRDMNNKITSTDNNDELTMTLQFNPTGEDRFTSGLFEEQLNDLFYGEFYKYDETLKYIEDSKFNNTNEKKLKTYL